MTRSRSSAKPRTSTASSADLATLARAGDHAATRDALIAAWRTHRSPGLAALVDTYAAKAPDAISAQLASAITPRVVSSLPRVKALAKLDDPRASGWAIEQLVALPFTTVAAEPLLAALVDIVARHADSRVHARREAIDAAIGTRIGRLAVRTSLAKRVARACAKIDEVKPHPHEAQLAEIAAPLRASARTARELLADIYANPDDDAPRVVYADLLSEAGDPRGEFITLQLERARAGIAEPSAREVELLKKHGKAWLGTLAPVLSWGRGYARTEFRRGFVAKADIILSVGKKLVPLMTDPAWATVEELEGVSWDPELLAKAPLYALRALDEGVDVETCQALAGRATPLNIATVRVYGLDGITRELLHAAFPKLQTLRVYARSTIPLADYAALGAPHLEVTSNWYDANELAAGQRVFEKQVAELDGARAFCERLTLASPVSRGRDDGAPIVFVAKGGRFRRATSA